MPRRKVVALTQKNHECLVVLASGKQVPSSMDGTTPIPATTKSVNGGIHVNKFLETIIPGVWAAGDVTNYPDHCQ